MGVGCRDVGDAALLEQEPGNGDGVLRPHHLEVALYGDEGAGLAAVETASLEVAGERTALPMKPRDGAVLWPNQDDHAYARVLLDAEPVEHRLFLARYGLPEMTLAELEHSLEGDHPKFNTSNIGPFVQAMSQWANDATGAAQE